MSLINKPLARLITPAAVLLLLAACGSSDPAPVAQLDTGPPAATPVDPALDPAAAEDAVREAELARREAELTLQEREQALAAREAELAARQRAAARPAPAPAPRPVAATPAPAPAAAPAPAPAPKPAVVPAGTELSVEMVSTVTTKTARVGDRIEARLSAPLIADGRMLATAGATVRGTVTEVYSGSQQIGGTPKLGLNFSQLQLESGTTIPISGQIAQQGQRESGRDAAKIAGGAIVGAVIGHQVDDSKGRVIGGLLGGAAGAAIAKQTGGDLEVPAGTVLGFVLDTPIEVD